MGQNERQTSPVPTNYDSVALDVVEVFINYKKLAATNEMFSRMLTAKETEINNKDKIIADLTLKVTALEGTPETTEPSEVEIDKDN